MRCLRKLLYIKWQDRIPNLEVNHKADMVNIYNAQEILAEVARACHMPNGCLPKRLFYGELKAGKFSHGGQKMLQRYSEGFAEVLWHQSQHLVGSCPSSCPPCTAWSTLQWLPMKSIEPAQPSRSAHSAKAEQATPAWPACPRLYSVPNGTVFVAWIGLIIHLCITASQRFQVMVIFDIKEQTTSLSSSCVTQGPWCPRSQWHHKNIQLHWKNILLAWSVI